MAELESSLILERVRAGMQAAKEEGKHVGRPATPDEVTQKIEQMAAGTDLSIQKIRDVLTEDVSRGVVGRIVKNVRSAD